MLPPYYLTRSSLDLRATVRAVFYVIISMKPHYLCTLLELYPSCVLFQRVLMPPSCGLPVHNCLICTQISLPFKLAALYPLGTILKNLYKPYARHFEPIVVPLFWMYIPGRMGGLSQDDWDAHGLVS